jgi:hypothetical protein
MRLLQSRLLQSRCDCNCHAASVVPHTSIWHAPTTKTTINVAEYMCEECALGFCKLQADAHCRRKASHTTIMIALPLGSFCGKKTFFLPKFSKASAVRFMDKIWSDLLSAYTQHPQAIVLVSLCSSVLLTLISHWCTKKPGQDLKECLSGVVATILLAFFVVGFLPPCSFLSSCLCSRSVCLGSLCLCSPYRLADQAAVIARLTKENASAALKVYVCRIVFLVLSCPPLWPQAPSVHHA